MVIFFFTSFLVLTLLAIAVYFWQKPANTSQTIELPPPEPQGLFSDFRVNQLRPSTEDQQPEDPAKVDREIFEQAIDAIRAFQKSPDKNTTTKLLHVAALSDNPKITAERLNLCCSRGETAASRISPRKTFMH